MKKSFYIICTTFLILGTTASAQNSVSTSSNEAQFGLKAGLNNSNVWDERGQDFEADSKFGFVAGAFLSIPISKPFGFQPEILFSQKGFQGSGSLLGSPYSFSRTTTYLDIPLQLQIRASNSFSFLIGPQYSYLIRQKDVFTSTIHSSSHEEEFENDNIRKNIMGFVTGIDLSFSDLVISGRAGWDFQTNHGDGSSSTPRYKNQWLQLTIGIKL